jgi:hypothetical protein
MMQGARFQRPHASGSRQSTTMYFPHQQPADQPLALRRTTPIYDLTNMPYRNERDSHAQLMQLARLRGSQLMVAKRLSGN